MNIKRIKNIAALFLLTCLVLPMSRCAKPIPPPPDGKASIQRKDSIEYNYLIPLKEIEINEPTSYLILLAFIWPLPLWFIKSKCGKNWSRRIVNIAEFLLLSFSWYLIILWTFSFGNPYWGGYIAVASITVLSILFLHQIASDIKIRIKPRTI